VLKDLNERQLDNFTKEFTIMRYCNLFQNIWQVTHIHFRSQFRSPDIVFFFGACIKPTPVMVLGYSSRGSLYNVMKDPTISLTWPIIVKVLYQVARGLHSLHNWKPQIVHRDLKVIGMLGFVWLLISFTNRAEIFLWMTIGRPSCAILENQGTYCIDCN
jgi:serine/threonine protein kinase